MPCRAQIWWIRAVPNISVPCPHDPVPCQIFPCRALMIRAQIWWIRAVRLRRASRNMGRFFWKKNACGNVPTSQGLPEIWGPFFVKKKAPAATYPQVQGFQKFAPLGIQAEKQGFRTAWLITGQKFLSKNLKSGSSLLTFRDLSSHICQIIMRMAKWGDWHFRKSLDFS